MSVFLRSTWYTAACLGMASTLCLIRAQDENGPGSALASSTNAPSAISTSPPAADQPNFSLRPAPTQEPGISEPAPAMPAILNFLPPADDSEDLAKHLLVVYNQNDPDSKSLADYYAAKRDIPPERVLALSCSGAEEINRADFEKTIREPILFYILQKNWMTRQSGQTQLGTRTVHLLVATHNDIWAIVLMRGVPLKIAPDPGDDDAMEDTEFFKAHGIKDPGVAPLFQTNAAAVDSELALLPIFGLPKGGFVPNMFFDGRGSGLPRVGSVLATRVILVSRLDGPTPAMVKRMIDDSLEAEQNRLAGLAVVDTCGIIDPKNPKFVGDLWLRNARSLLQLDGWTVRFDDSPNVLPTTDPLNQVALYLGWYSDHAEGPWMTPPNRFVPGAIAYHLHSFSANTVRSETSNWVGPLIAHGADATMGTVYEPLLSWTPHEDIFTKRLLGGNYFVEAAYASMEGISWMVTVVGDPLYRPFRLPLNAAVAAAGNPRTVHDDWLLLQQVNQQLLAGQIQANAGQYVQSLNVPGAGPVAEERLADLLEKLHDAQANISIEQAYEKALAAYTLPVDEIRVGMKLAQHYNNRGQQTRAKAQYDIMRQQFPEDALRFGVPGAVATTIAPSVPAVPAASIKPAPSSTKNAVEPALPHPPKPPLPPFPQPATGEQ